MIEYEKNEILNLQSKSNLSCTLCEKCCEYRGDIKITPINVLQISKYLKVSIDDFLEKYTDEVKDEEPEIAIKGVGEKRECIFNDRKTYKCKIHKVKPMQCVVFPLVPIDVKRDLFINTNACKVASDNKTKVDKWVNGNHKIYNKNKWIYLKWIEFIEEVQPRWSSLSSEKKDLIKDIIFKNYDTKKDYNRQVIQNIKKARQIVYNN